MARLLRTRETWLTVLTLLAATTGVIVSLLAHYLSLAADHWVSITHYPACRTHHSLLITDHWCLAKEATK